MKPKRKAKPRTRYRVICCKYFAYIRFAVSPKGRRIHIEGSVDGIHYVRIN